MNQLQIDVQFDSLLDKGLALHLYFVIFFSLSASGLHLGPTLALHVRQFHPYRGTFQSRAPNLLDCLSCTSKASRPSLLFANSLIVVPGKLLVHWIMN